MSDSLCGDPTEPLSPLTIGAQQRTVHSSLLHQVADGLQLRHDLVLLLLGNRFHATEENGTETWNYGEI